MHPDSSPRSWNTLEVGFGCLFAAASPRHTASLPGMAWWDPLLTLQVVSAKLSAPKGLFRHPESHVVGMLCAGNREGLGAVVIRECVGWGHWGIQKNSVE